MSLLDTASLLLTPNAYKEGKLYSVIPSDGSGDFTFTRATTATRVNSDGLVELVPYNLLQRSEEFNNAYWNKNGGSISANSSTAPNGTLTADRLTLAATTATHGLIDFGVGGVAASTYTVSFYVKKGTHRYITIGIYRNTLNNAGAGFDLDTNTVTGTGATGTGYSASGATMTDVGDGWYRCSVVCVSGTTPMTGSGLFLRNTSYTSGAIQESWAASGTETINLWGAQLVEGTNALPYQKTETRLNIPRLDYSLGGCPSILLEPQRTNLALQSSSFDSATWSKTGITVTPNQGIAPDGTMTMDLITFDSAARATTQGISVTSGATYTFSVWLATQSGTQTVDIGNVNTSTFQSVTVTTTPQRFEVTQVASASTRYPAIRSTAAYSIFAWGAQLEAGSYATSYIPTTTAGVTRNQDLMLLSNIYTNNLLTSSGGTWFVDFRNNVPLSRDAQVRFGLGDTSAISLNSMYFVSGVTNGRLIIQKRVAGAVTTLYTTTADTCKIAFKWNGATMDIFENGFKVIADSVFTSTDLNFFNGIASTPFFINSMLLAPTPLTDAECIQLTTI
jgi:hypothetical protein